SLKAVVSQLTDDMINAIVTNRPNPQNGWQWDDSLTTPAWLMSKAQIPATVMSKLDKYITTTTQVYRFQVLAYADGGGPVVRIEAVVDTNKGNPRILYQRDITELGKGFDPHESQ